MNKTSCAVYTCISKQKVQTLCVFTSPDRQHINTECDQEFGKNHWAAAKMQKLCVAFSVLFEVVASSLLIRETQQNHFVPVKFLLNDPKAPRKQSASDGEERNTVSCFFILFFSLSQSCCNLQVEPFWKPHCILAACILLLHCCYIYVKG